MKKKRIDSKELRKLFLGESVEIKTTNPIKEIKPGYESIVIFENLTNTRLRFLMKVGDCFIFEALE